MLMCIY